MATPPPKPALQPEVTAADVSRVARYLEGLVADARRGPDALLRLLAASGALRVEAALLEGNENAEHLFHARNAMIAEVEAERAAAARLTSWEVIPAGLADLDDAKWREVQASGRIAAVLTALAEDKGMADYVHGLRITYAHDQRVKMLVRRKAPGSPPAPFHAFGVTFDGNNFAITSTHNVITDEDRA